MTDAVNFSAGADLNIKATGDFTGRDSTHITTVELNFNKLLEIMQDSGECDPAIDELVKQALVFKEAKKETQLFETVAKIVVAAGNSFIATWITKTLIG